MVEGPDSRPVKCKEFFLSQQTLLNTPDVPALCWQKAEHEAPSHRYPDLLSGHNEAAQCSGPQVCILSGCCLQGRCQPTPARCQAVPYHRPERKQVSCVEGGHQVDGAPASYLWGCAGVIAVLNPQMVHRCVLPTPHGTDVCQLLPPVLWLPAWRLELLGPLSFLTI